MLSPLALKDLPILPVSDKGWNIEDIATQMLTDTAGASSPGGKKKDAVAHSPKATGRGSMRPLTPRSAEACLMEGIEPEELQPRPLDYFTAHGVDLAIARMRYEIFERTRQEKLASVRNARAMLMENPAYMEHVTAIDFGGPLPESPGSKGGSPSRGRKLGGSGGSVGRGSADHSPSGRASSVGSGSGHIMDPIAREQARLAKVQARQQKEIQQFVAQEMRIAQMKEAAEKKAAQEAERRAAYERVIEQRRKEEAQDRQERELRKAKDEAAKEKEMAAIAAATRAKEMAAAAEQARKKKEMAREAAEKEQERLKRTMEFKHMLEQRQQQKQAEMLARVEALNEAEAMRNARLAEAEKLRKQMAEEKRKQAADRIRSNMRMAQEMEEERIDGIKRKEFLSEKRRKEKLMEEEVLRANRVAALMDDAARRAQMLEEARVAEEQRKAALLAKQYEEAMLLRKAQEDAAKDLHLRREVHRLEEQEKEEAIQRQKRKEDYKRLMMMRNIAARNQKMESLKYEKKNAVESRKALAREMAKQRGRILTIFEKAKSGKNWDAAQTMVEKAMAEAAEALNVVAGRRAVSSSGTGFGFRGKVSHEGVRRYAEEDDDEDVAALGSLLNEKLTAQMKASGQVPEGEAGSSAAAPAAGGAGAPSSDSAREGLQSRGSGGASGRGGAGGLLPLMSPMRPDAGGSIASLSESQMTGSVAAAGGGGGGGGDDASAVDSA